MAWGMRVSTIRFSSAVGLGCVAGLSWVIAVGGEARLDPVVIRAIAEVEVRNKDQARPATQLVSADRVVSGDQVIYTLEVRNTAASTVHAPTVTYAVPAHMRYVADSAVGPGAAVSFSVDGGRSFDSPENLEIATEKGRRAAAAADYTHIRWQLAKDLKANSVAFVRFRALVK
jgi:uncharacterized repeat protein (TIGR01451 family)